MRIHIAVVAIMLFTSIGYADNYKAYWRCKDEHIEAIEPHEILDDKKIDLYVYYTLSNEQTLHSSPLGLKSLVNLPSNFNHEKFLMLGSKEQWFMNCVGQVVLSPHYPQGKIVFNVHRNAYGCPLIPKDCGI